jgi:hypothetical protein
MFSLPLNVGYYHWTWWIIRAAPANAFRADFLLIRPYNSVLHPVGPRACTCFHLHQAASCSFTGRLLTSFTLTLVRMAPAAGDGTGLPALSIVGSFSPLPWLEYAGGLVVPPTCHLVLETARVPPKGV